MKNVKDTIKNGINKSFEALKNSLDFTLEKIETGLDAIGSLGPEAKEKFKNYVNELAKDLPLLEKVGFRTISMEIGVSIPPSFELHFQKLRDPSAEEIKELKNELKGKKLMSLILKSLLTANSFQQSISTPNFEFNIITIDVTVPPQVTVKFKRKETVELPE